MNETQSSKKGRGSRGAGFESGVVSFSLVLNMADRMESFCDKLDFLIEAGQASGNDSKPEMALILIEEAVAKARKASKEFLELAGTERDAAGGNGVRVVHDKAARLGEAKDQETKAIYGEAEQKMKVLWAARK